MSGLWTRERGSGAPFANRHTHGIDEACSNQCINGIPYYQPHDPPTDKESNHLLLLQPLEHDRFQKSSDRLPTQDDYARSTNQSCTADGGGASTNGWLLAELRSPRTVIADAACDIAIRSRHRLPPTQECHMFTPKHLRHHTDPGSRPRARTHSKRHARHHAIRKSSAQLLYASGCARHSRASGPRALTCRRARGHPRGAQTWPSPTVQSPATRHRASIVARTTQNDGIHPKARGSSVHPYTHGLRDARKMEARCGE